MLAKHLEYLKKQLRATGFPETLDAPLEAQLAKKADAFQLYHHAHFGSDEVVAVLYFTRSEQSELYLFHRFDLSMKLSASTAAITQAFQRDRERQLTLREAFNLLQGRAVNKHFVTSDGVPYTAWVQLDFTHRDGWGNYVLKYYHERYGFHLEEELRKYPFRELQDASQKARLLAALRAGDRQQVVCPIGDKEETYLIEANPRFKSLKLYDQQLRRVSYRLLMAGRPAESNPSPPAPTRQTGKKRPEKKKAGPARRPVTGAAPWISLTDFLCAAEEDGRITLSHIGLFAALLQYWRLQGYRNPFRVFSRQIMPIARISTRLTYCKYIRELAEFGYIRYEPSFRQNQGSLVAFLPAQLL